MTTNDEGNVKMKHDDTNGLAGKRGRSATIAGLALAALWSAGCTDDAAPEVESTAAPELSAAAASAGERARMEAYLAGRYDAADVAHSFTQPSGDVVDCVRRERQPALRGAGAGAGARGRGLATPPPFSPASSEAPASRDGMEAFLVKGPRDARGAERFCPPGTVPVRRLELEDLARYGSLDEQMRKHPSYKPQGRDVARLGSSAEHQHAVALQTGLYNQGAHTRINIYNPYVETGSEFSLSQLWVLGGSGSNFQSLEAGFQKYPNKYGTWQPHLFIYSTSDGYGPQGCYNLDCGRFVQVDHQVVIGGALPASIPGGAQYELEASFVLWAGNWWFGANGIWVGYYPGGLFNAAGLANGADRIDFGGEIIDDRGAHPGRHTMTDMGSGAFPSAWWPYAAYQRDIWYWTDPAHAYYATGLWTAPTDSYCYDVSLHVTSDPTWRTFLFMGGNGYDANCL